MKLVVAVVVVWGLGGLGCGPPARQEWKNTFTGSGEDAFLLDDDFTCLGDANWEKVGKIRLFNKLDHQADAVAFAKSKAKGSYPIGTVVQLSSVEAMVKRGVGFSKETGDWEMLQLDHDGKKTVITARGTTEIKNPAGTCVSCHAPAKDFDFICDTNTACAALPFFIDTDIDPKTDDPRCQ